MQNNPTVIGLLILAYAYFVKLWLDDLKAEKSGKPNPNPLPGAKPVGGTALIIAAVGGLVLVALETWGEIRLGIADQQSKMTALFALYSLAAAFGEEIVFRGYIVVNNRGPAVRWAAAVGASAIFALVHFHLFEWKDSQLVWHLDAKGWFSTGALFVGSLWFYFVRFASFNPNHSLAPCFAGHLAKNAGVIAVKAWQGHMSGLY
jgi:uncharacterized protein